MSATTTSPAGELTDEERTFVGAASQCLAKCSHSTVRALHERLDALLNPSREQAVLKAMNQEVVELQKRDPGLSRYQAMEKARRDNPALARELHDASRGVAA
jgi:hypothetical protein